MKKIFLLYLLIGNICAASQCDTDAQTFKAAHEGDFTRAFMYKKLNTCRGMAETDPLVEQELSALIMMGEGVYASEEERFRDAIRLVIAAASKGSETALNELIGEFRYGDQMDGIQIIAKDEQIAECLEKLNTHNNKIDGKKVANCLPTGF